jgi:hypothetical protein
MADVGIRLKQFICKNEYHPVASIRNPAALNFLYFYIFTHGFTQRGLNEAWVAGWGLGKEAISYSPILTLSGWRQFCKIIIGAANRKIFYKVKCGEQLTAPRLFS